MTWPCSRSIRNQTSTKSSIGIGENVSGNTGGPDWRDACCGGGQLHLWGAWQEGQVWDHTHQVCPITRYLHDWGCQVLCFFFQLTKANVKIKCWCWNIWTSEINFDLFQPSHAWEDARHLQGQSWGNSCCFDKCCNEVEFFFLLQNYIFGFHFNNVYYQGFDNMKSTQPEVRSLA